MCPSCGYNLVADAIVTVGAAFWDPRGDFIFAGQVVHLTPQEHIVVGTLLKACGRVVSKDALMLRTGSEADGVVAVLACRLRRKLRAVGADAHFENAWGKGYVWRETPATAAA